MRFAVEMAVMPNLETVFVSPVSEKPNLIGAVERNEHFEANEAGRFVNQMRALQKSLPDLFCHLVGNRKPAERDESRWPCARQRAFTSAARGFSQIFRSP